MADSGHNRISRFTSQGTLIDTFGEADLWMPHGVTVDSQGYIFVTDTGHNKVAKFNPDGTLVWHQGGPGSGPGQYNDPYGIVVEASGTILVADSYNYRIQRLAADGTYLEEWGSHGLAAGQFRNHPWCLSLDRDGNIYVTNGGDWWAEEPPFWGIIYKFAPNGTLLAEYGDVEESSGDFIQVYFGDSLYFPYGLAVGPDGNIWVAEIGNRRVRKISSSGTPLASWQSWGWGTGQLATPTAIACDASGRPYVLEEAGWRIERFTPDGLLDGIYGPGYDRQAPTNDFVPKAVAQDPLDA